MEFLMFSKEPISLNQIDYVVVSFSKNQTRTEKQDS